MTRNLKSCLAGIFVALLLLSLTACKYDIVYVSSLSDLRQAIDSAPTTGRIIILQAGVYDQSSPIYIRNKNDITIYGDPSSDADVVIRGPGINDKSLGVNFKINNSDYIRLVNLTIKDSYYHAVQINKDSDYFAAVSVKTLDNGESGFKVTSPANGSGLSSYSDHGTIENSFIGFTQAGQRRVVEGVDIVGGAGWVVRNNVFENIRKPNGGAAYAVFAKGNAQDIVFEDNVVRNGFIGLSFGGGGTGRRYFRNGYTKCETRGGAIRGNLIYNVADAGIYLNKACNFKVYNNVVIDSGKRTGSIEARYAQSSGIIRDNVVSRPIKLRNGGKATKEGNTFVPQDTPIPDRRDWLSVDKPAMTFLLEMGLAGVSVSPADTNGDSSLANKIP